MSLTGRPEYLGLHLTRQLSPYPKHAPLVCAKRVSNRTRFFLIVLGLSSGLDFLDGCLLFASQRSSAASIMPTDPRFATTFRARLI